MRHRAALAVLLVVLAAPAAAAAGGLREFLVGPIPVGHGYSVSAFRIGCGPNEVTNPVGFGDYGIDFVKSIPGGTETHTYFADPTDATCDFTTGRFKLTLGTWAMVEVTFHPHGSAWQGSRYPGCGGRRPLFQAGTATGTFRVDIDPFYFGSVNLHRIRASIRTAGASPCADVSMDADFGHGFGAAGLSAWASPEGHTWLEIQKDTNVNRTIQSTHTMYLTGGTALFDPTPDLASATVNGPGGPVTGQLRYSSTSPTSATLSGSLRVAFDVIGTTTLTGSATGAYGGPQLNACGPLAEVVCF